MIRAVKFLVVCLWVILVFSCKIKKSDVGIDVLPEDKNLNVSYSDTTTIQAITLLDDSLKADEMLSNYIGSYNDPIFGYTESSVYFQALFPSNIQNVDFGNFVYDSLVLSMPYSGSYYGSLNQQIFKVYKVTEDMYRDSAYTSAHQFAYDSVNPIATYRFFPAPSQKIIVDGKTQDPAIRIPLDNLFGKDLADKSGTTTFNNNTELLKYLKGFYVKSVNVTQDPGAGALLGFLMNDKTQLLLYYRKIKQHDQFYYFEKHVQSFPVTSSSARIINIKHNYSTASTNEVLTQLNSPDPSHSKVYIQGMAGTQVKITLPYIHNWNNDSMAVNKAELVIKVDPSNGTSLSPPTTLYLAQVDSLGEYYQLTDAAGNEQEFHGGSYNSANQEYKFNISRYVQNLLNGSIPNNGIMLLTDERAKYIGTISTLPPRVVLGSSTNTAGAKMYLRIVYTKL